MTSKLKGYKITNVSRTKICGIAAKSLEDVLSKSCGKFQVKRDDVNLHLQDGTIVDTEEYFSTIPAQTMLILVRKDETVLTGADIIYGALAALNRDYLITGGKVRRFFDENLKEKVRALARLVGEPREGEDRTPASSRHQHPEWFSGLDTGCTRKETFMAKKAQDRIRGYLYKTKEEIRKCNLYKNDQFARKIMEQALENMKKKLSLEGFMAGYFNREDPKRLCDSTGCFTCSGSWSQIKCEHRGGKGHWINPYTSRESRIIFSTWNLDHRIERSRSVIPAFLEATAKVASNSATQLIVNCEYFYKLLFTKHNLRLVHVVCHDKAAHSSAKPDPDLTIISLAPARKVLETDGGITVKN